MTMINKILQSISRVANSWLPNETIIASKKKWNKLAEENARYYVVSKDGVSIDEPTFVQSGGESYRAHVAEDLILKGILGDFSKATVLNIGCGIGRLEEFFAPNFKEIHGIDISESMISQAQKRLGHLSNVKFLATDGVSYPFADNSFDLVFSYIVFQHMPSREVVEKNFQEIFRVLKPGKIAKIQVRGGHQPYKWQWFYGPAWKKEDALSMVEKIGFKVIKTDGEKTKRFWLWLTK